MSRRLAPLVVFLATFLAFAGAFDNGFVDWDDDRNFVENPHWRGLSAENTRWALTTRLLGPYQPLSWLSLQLDFELFGDGPLGPHVGNGLYHALAALMLFLVARRLLAKALACDAKDGAVTLGAAFAALAFGLHPLRVESVAWATERRDVLSGFLLAASVLLYLRAVESVAGESAPRTRVGALALAVLVYALSLGAKAIGMTLPLVLLILDAWPLGRLAVPGGWRRCLAEKLIFAVPAAAAAWIALGGQAEADALLDAGQLGFLDRVRIAGWATCFYVGKTLWPAALWPHYQIPLDLDFGGAGFALATLGAVAVTVLALAVRRRAPWLAAGWGSYLVLLAPVSGLALAGRQLAADRYAYLPGMVFGLVAGGAFAWVELRAARGARLAVRAAGVLVLAALAARTVQQAELWRDSRTLWVHVLRHEPESVPAHNNLAQQYVEAGEWDVALVHLEAARRLAPAEPAVHLNLGLHQDRLGRVDEALASVGEAARLDPRLWNARFFLGAKLLDLGRPGPAAEHLAAAAALRPGFVPGRVLLARALAAAGRTGEAAGEIEAARALPGIRPPQLLTLAGLAEDLGRPDLARATLATGLERFPESPELARRLSELGP